MRPHTRGDANLSITMARRRTIILHRPSASGGMEALGTFKDILASTGRFNVGSDGSGASGFGDVPGMAVLHGPGFTLEIPDDGSPRSEVMQVMASVTDEDFAWPVLSRMCKANSWKMMDPDSGRTFG
jgi:hypothetical protein